MQAAQLLGEALALGLAPRHQLIERAAEHLLQRRPRQRGVRGLRLFHAHDAGTLEHPRQRHLAGDACAGEIGGQRAGALDVLARERSVGDDALGGLSGHRGDLHRDVHAPALQPRGDHAPGIELERGQRTGQAEGDVEVAVVDGARLDRHDDSVAAQFRAPKPGHAADHGVLQNG